MVRLGLGMGEVDSEVAELVTGWVAQISLLMWAGLGKGW